jgi:hypothetical protein
MLFVSNLTQKMNLRHVRYTCDVVRHYHNNDDDDDSVHARQSVV